MAISELSGRSSGVFGAAVAKGLEVNGPSHAVGSGGASAVGDAPADVLSTGPGSPVSGAGNPPPTAVTPQAPQAGQSSSATPAGGPKPRFAGLNVAGLPGAADRGRLEEIIGLLERTAIGRETLRFAREAHLPIAASEINWSQYDPETRALLLGRYPSAVEAALAFVHEAQHARTYAAGRWPDPRQLTLEAWLSAVFEQEAAAYGCQFDAQRELGAAGITLASGQASSWATDAMWQQYGNTYRAALNIRLARGMAPAAAEAEARRAARGMVKLQISTDQSYVAHYTAWWEHSR